MSRSWRGTTAEEAVPARNAETGRPQSRYVLGHEAHLEATAREVSGYGRIVGYYHSHPRGGPTPSEWDRQQAVEGVSYLIAGLMCSTEGERDTVRFAAWECAAGELRPVPLEVVESELDEAAQTGGICLSNSQGE